METVCITITAERAVKICVTPSDRAFGRDGLEKLLADIKEGGDDAEQRDAD